MRPIILLTNFLLTLNFKPMQNKNLTIGRLTPNKAIAWNVVDDCIDFIQDLTQGSYSSIFDHPSIAFYKRLHDEFGIPTLMAMFYCKGYNVTDKTDTWNLSMATDAFKSEFEANASWLKVQFHSWTYEVRYRSGYTGVVSGVDYSRNAYDDWVTTKAQCNRIFGTTCWYKDFYVPHFYDLRQSEAQQLFTNEGVRGLIAPTLNNIERKESSYLNQVEFANLVKYGVIQDRGVGMVHVLRDFATERVDGSLKTFYTPKHVIEYLNNYNHLSLRFQNPETHEIQIKNDTPATYDSWTTRHSLLDWGSWCKERNIKGGFPIAGDFELFQY